MVPAYVLLCFRNLPGHAVCLRVFTLYYSLSSCVAFWTEIKHLLCLQLEGYKYAGNDQKKDIRMRFFHTHQNIHPNHVFQPVVSPPTVDDRKPRVNWVDFHTVMPVNSMDTNHSGRLEALAGLWRTSGPPILIHPPHHILLTSLPLLASWNMAYKQCLSSSHTVDKQLQVAHTSSITLHALNCLFIKPCNLLGSGPRCMHLPGSFVP